MKVHRLIISLFLYCMAHMGAFGQNTYTRCTAAFLNDHLIVNEYSPEGKCMLDSTSRGMLTVCPATYENGKWTQEYQAEFMVAVRDKDTRTFWMFSDKRYKKLEISKVLAECRKGDQIVLLTVDSRLALPHNEILVL